MKDDVTVKVPGKIILAGEHAVLNGAPAIVCAINRYLTVTASQNQQSGCDIFIDKQRYSLSRQNTPGLLPSPLNYIKHVIDLFAQHSGQYPRCNLLIDSNIPVGCGFGASAALALGLLSSLSEWYDIYISDDVLIDLAKQAESMQHGKSSGIDISTCWHGGCWLFDKDNSRPISLGDDLAFAWSNSGSTQSKTHECVKHTQAKLQQNPELVVQAKEAVQQLLVGINERQPEIIHQSIKNYHEVLIQLDVVPKNIIELINKANLLGISGKVAGSGSLQGNQVGCLLWFGNTKKLDAPFAIQPLQVCQRGCHVVD